MRALETPIFSPTGTLVYISVRESRGRGNCTLQRVIYDGKGLEDVAETEYRFGCFRDPVVRLSGGDEDDGEREEIVIKGKGMWTRSVGFENPSQGRFEWRYGTKRERAAVGKGIDSLLILERTTTNSEKKEEKIKIAHLIRSKETRSPGSKKSSAGNGGLLEMDLGSNGAFKEEGEQVNEGLVVATCLVMLKKEVDRRREVLALALDAGAGGGG